jgi:hypothetical protein
VGLKIAPAGAAAAVTSSVSGAKRVMPAPIALTFTWYWPGGVAADVMIVSVLTHGGWQVARENRYVAPAGRLLARKSTCSALPEARVAVTVSVVLFP